MRKRYRDFFFFVFFFGAEDEDPGSGKEE